MSETTLPAIPVAVVGMSAIYPGETGLAGFWRTIVSGRDAIGDVPPSHWLIDDYYDADPSAPDKTYCKRGGFIERVAFDPMLFGLPPNALPATDSAQLLALIAAKQALDQASRGHATVDPDRISVVLGVASTTELVVQMGARLQRPIWRKALLENGVPETEADAICKDIADHYAPWQESTFPGLLGNVVAGRIANRLNLGGTNYVTDAACASSLSALQVALHELYLHESDMVLTGGVDALNDIMMFMCFSKTPAFSPTGDCRPFSDAADGTIIGEGVGMLALKRLSDAERDGDVIHGVIRGLGSSSDGRASSVYAPRSDGQAKALRRAYERAGYAPSTVGLLEAHGTATKAGDVAEFAGLASVFVADAGALRCALGSVKSQIGHTKAAAGAAGMIKAVLALQHATLPGTLKVERPNTALNIPDTPFYINAQTRPWVRTSAHPRRASVSSFGFGGSNFHVTLEEYRGPGAAKRIRALPSELVLLSAPTAQALAERCDAVVQMCRKGETLARIAFDAATAFDPSHTARAGVVAAGTDALVTSLSKLAAALARDGAGDLRDPDVSVSVGPARTGKTAFLFSGQGSQYVGMGADLALAFPEALAVWDGLASDADVAGLAAIVFPEPAFDDAARARQNAALTSMANAQPAIAAAGLAQLALLERLGLKADVFAGHSFGEVSALAAAGVIARDRLVEVARMRGRLMTDAAGAQEGAMLAVAASAAEVTALLATEPALAQSLVLANDNAPGQVVLAGATADIAGAEALAKAARLTAFRLPVASAFHSPIIAPSCAPFEAFLKTLKFGRQVGPVFANATAKPYGKGVAAQLADQLRQPVRFREMITAMAAAGVTRFIEVGPGRILTGLVVQILTDTPHLAVALDDRKAGDLRGWHRGLAALAADGVKLDLAALFESYDPPERHTSPPAHAVMVGGANLGKPYPPENGAVVITPKRTAGAAVATAAHVQAPPPVATAVTTTPMSSTVLPVAVDMSTDAWSLIDRIQSETVAQHRHYLEVMAQSHQSFLTMSEQMLAQIVGQPGVAAAAPKITSIVTPPGMLGAAQFQNVAAPSIAPSVPAPPPVVIEALLAPVASPDDIVLAIVSEKTGYPVEMLGLDMEMEAELGIDSIKQVEILAAVQGQFPDAPEIAASELATMKTLRDVANKIAAVAGTVSAPPAAQKPVAPQPLSPVLQLGSSSMADPVALEASVIQVVAEKTGYPADMLNLDMEMESELGIDSIKQVEILSALQDRWPDAPDVEPSTLAGLKTLRNVVAAFSALASPAAAAQPVAAPSVSARDSAATHLRATAAVLASAPPTGFAMAGLRDGGIVQVTNENAAFADDVVSALAARGIAASATSVPLTGSGAVISLAGLGDAADASASLDVHLAAFRAAQCVARSDAATRLFVTVQSTGGAFSLEEGTTADGFAPGVSGIVKTAAREWDNASVKAIDLEVLDANRLVEELLAGGPELGVALRSDGRRLVVIDAPVAAMTARAIGLPRNGVVVVSGGARGVTARCAIKLAAKHGVRLALLGRTLLGAPTVDASGRAGVAEITTKLVERARLEGLVLSLADARAQATRLVAQREVESTITEARTQGVEARYFAVDVGRVADVSAALDQIRSSFGPIVGLVHGAGVLADKLLADMDETQFRTVFIPKVFGIEGLLAATRNDALSVIALFSSVAARTGNAGQAAYATANEVLNCLAMREAARRGEACAVRSFGWGPWDGGMVDASLKRHFERAGVGVIPLEAGAAFFAEEACKIGGPVSIVAAAPAVSPPRSARLEWLVSQALLPPLADHVVQNRIVLPVVVVMERIVRAARALVSDGNAPLVVRDLQVLSGVTIPIDSDDVSPLFLSFEPKGAGHAVTVRDGAQRPRYRAMVEWSVDDRRAHPPARPFSPAPWPLTVEQAYAGPLFHGARFAAVKTLESIGKHSGVAVIKGLSQLGWPEEPWALDPVALDGALQLGLLWTNGDGRPLMLPQRIGHFIQHSAMTADTALRCRFEAHPVSDKRVDFDFTLETLEGVLAAELLGAEFYALGAAAIAAP